MESNIYLLIDKLDLTRVYVAIANTEYLPKPDFNLESGIERMDGQNFSLGIFIFMVIGVVIFSGLTFLVIFGKKSKKVDRLGERLMFAGLILGVVMAVIIGASQMLIGYTF